MTGTTATATLFCIGALDSAVSFDSTISSNSGTAATMVAVVWVAAAATAATVEAAATEVEATSAGVASTVPETFGDDQHATHAQRVYTIHYGP